MNWYLCIAGVFAAFTTIGHFTVGSKSFLKPMLEASFDEVAKKVMHCVFHYMSAYLILSTLVLLFSGFGFGFGSDNAMLVKFIAVNYILFALWQIILALLSDIKNPLFKLFQWVFFTLIAVFAWLGG